MKGHWRAGLGWLLALAASLAIGCGKSEDFLREAKSRSAPAADLFSSDAIAQGAKELEAKVGGSLRMLDLMAENGSVRFQYEVPGKKGEVDQYELRGGELLGPKPVQLIGGGSLEDNLFTLADADLACIPELGKRALAKLAIADAKVSSVRVRKEEPADAIQKRIHRQAYALEVHFVMYVDSARSKGMIVANGKCEIIKDVKF